MNGQLGYVYQRFVHSADSAQRNGFQCCKISLALIRSHGFSPMVSAALMYEKLLPTRLGQFRNGSRPLSKFGGCRIHDVHLRLVSEAVTGWPLTSPAIVTTAYSSLPINVLC